MSVLMFLSLALAQEPEADQEVCDPNALAKVISTSTGDAAAEAFVKLADCDPDKAKHFAKTTITTFVPSKLGYEAAVAGMKIGVDEYVLQWMDAKLQPDEQKKALRKFGEACGSDSNIQQFFINSAQNDPEKFWGKRYYQYLSSCKTAEITAIFEDRIDRGIEGDRSKYFDVLSAYARNLEAKALPKLIEKLQTTDDGEVQVNIISAIEQALDETIKNNAGDEALLMETVAVGVNAISEMGEKLQPNALTQARSTLTTLEAEQEADMMAGYFYKRLLFEGADAAAEEPVAEEGKEDATKEEGVKEEETAADALTYVWGLVVVENVTCKKGKMKQSIHAGIIKDQGHMWADQLEERVTPAVEDSWNINLVKSCKAGTGTPEYIYSTKPFRNDVEFQLWADKLKLEHKNKDVKKVVIVDHNPLSI